MHACTRQRIFVEDRSSLERNYLQRSIIPSYYFQKSLPRLPLPLLEKTSDRFLKALTQLVNVEQLAATTNVVEKFQLNEGRVLHNELVALNKKNKHTSYISGPWFDMYLKDRRPVPLTHSPFIAFQDDPRPEYNTQLLRAANCVISSAKFMKSLKDEVLEPDVYHLHPSVSDTGSFRRFVRWLPQSLAWYGAYWYKAFPLDMSQYLHLFNSTRLPRPERDILYRNEQAKHLVVMRNGEFYIFDIFDNDGHVIEDTEVLAHLQHILSLSATVPRYPIGVLTTTDRDSWSVARSRLMEAGPENKMSLQLLDSAAFCLVLDDADISDPISLSRSFLFADGVNRWFDKSFQLIITRGGKAAVNFEHSWGDGVAVMRYFKEVYKDTTTNASLHPGSSPSAVESAKMVRKLDFTLDSFLKERITMVKEAFAKRTASVDMNYLECNELNKAMAKQHNLSPDSLMQLIIQIAQYRLSGRCVGMYESCSTAAFKHGRTETIRSCTTETHKVCQLLLEKGKGGTVKEILQAIRDCSTIHNRLTKEAAMGQGFDRHLFALRKLAESKGESPDLFQDVGYRTMIHDVLSTSTLPDPSVLIGGFCPVVHDGYGIGYAIQDKGVGFSVTAYKPNSATEFVQCLEASLADVHCILRGQMPTKLS